MVFFPRTAVKEDRNVDWKVLLPTQFRVNLGDTDIELLKGSLQYIKDKTYLVRPLKYTLPRNILHIVLFSFHLLMNSK